MANLDKQVRKVLRRINFERFVKTLIWCWAGALMLSLIVVLIEKATAPLVEPTGLLVASCLGIGTILASIIWLFIRQSPVEAAQMLDSAFDLRERVSTTLTLDDRLKGSAAGNALVADTMKRIESIDVSEKFGFRLPKTSWVPLVPGLLVALVTIFVSPFGTTEEAEAKPTVSPDQAQVKNSAKALVKKLTPKKPGAETKEMTDTEKLIKDLVGKLEKDLSDDDSKLDKKQAMTKLHEFRDTLKDRREELGDAEEIKKALSQLQATSERGPADKFQEALKAGDFKTALKAMKELQDQMKKGKLDSEQAKKLQKQLDEIQKQLSKLAELQEKREKLMEAAKKGQISKEILQKELKKLAAQENKMEAMKKLSEKLAETQKAMAEGDMKKAAEALGMSEAQLQQLAQDVEELGMLEDTLDDLAEMRNAMTCKNCSGQGCSMCQGTGTNPMMSGMPGEGMGRGRGTGERAEQEDSTRGFKTRTPGAINKNGKMQIKGFVQGPQSRGESFLTEQDVIEAGGTTNSEAVAKQRIPRDYKDQAREYFEKFQK